MNKTLLFISLVLITSVFVTANYNVVPSNGHASVSIPEHVIQLAPGVFSLGTSVIDGKVVEGLMFVHYARNNNAKPPMTNGGPSCYSFLAKGAKWKSLENWVVNPLNTQSLDGNFVLNNLALDVQKWED
ncbi:MAG: hypothetical protein AABX84_01265, partial [Nanoarchaeota archaeon]